ncbi:GIY-YIG nuclease family protein [Parvimonas micra]
MFYVYIISNNFRNALYIGVTRNIERRLYEHKNKLIDGFSKKYNLNVLLFYETTEYPLDAIAREKQLKKWNREKKFNLIKSINPELRNLSEDW